MKSKLLSALLLTITTIVITAAPVLAANKITNVSVYFTESRQDPGIVWIVSEPASVTYGVEIMDYSWSMDYSEWTPGETVTLTCTMVTNDGFSLDKKISGSSSYGKVASTSRKSGSEAIIKINYTPRYTLTAPTGICYDEFELTWDKVDYAGGYTVQINKDGGFYKSISLTGRNTTSLDVSEYISDAGDDSDGIFTISVKAVPSQSTRSYIYESAPAALDDNVSSDDGLSTVQGRFYGDGTYKYFLIPGNKKAAGWQMINNAWYYFDPSTGYAKTGWFLDPKNNWYLFGNDAKMLTGWQQSNGLWYFLNDGTSQSLPIGVVLTGWIASGPNGPWYYLNVPDGHMLTNATTPDGHIVDASGKMIQ